MWLGNLGRMAHPGHARPQHTTAPVECNRDKTSRDKCSAFNLSIPASTTWSNMSNVLVFLQQNSTMAEELASGKCPPKAAAMAFPI